jgi:hypothetical protein
MITTSESIPSSLVTFSSVYSSESCSSEYCESCDVAMKAVLAFVSLAFIFSFPSAYTNYLRTTQYGNTHQNYRHGIASSAATMFCIIVAIVIFSVGCRLKIETDPNNSTIKWEYGPSFILIITVLIMKAIDLVINTLTPLADGRRLIVVKPSSRYLAGYGTGVDDPLSPGGRLISEEDSEMMHFKVYRWWDLFCMWRF